MDPYRLPLSPGLLDDPAFSSDPRSHPHFSLSNALSYKAVPSKSPPRDHRSFPLPTRPKLSKPLPPIIPEILPKRDSATSVLKSVSINVPRKKRMRAFVRRLTARHSLDRIDELDETDPFGTNYHHDGPYEAIASNIVQPTPSRTSGPPRANILHSARESDPHRLRPRHNQFTHRIPPLYGETGLSLHLKPGQVLQPNTIYGSCAAGIAAPLGQFPPQPNTVSIPTRPEPPRRQSLPNSRTRPYDAPSSSHPRDSLQNRHASLPAHRERYFVDHAPDIPSNSPLHDAAPYVHHQTERVTSPPPRYESSVRASGRPRSPQHTPPSFSIMSSQTQPAENIVPASSHDSRSKTTRSLDSSHAVSNKFTQSSSGVQNRPLDPPRIRHLPKRLVMPAPLQPQTPQPQHNFPPSGSPTWQDEHLDDHALEDVHFHGKPALYSEESRLLRKRSSAFPAGTPIPDHVPMSPDDVVSIIASSSAKAAEETKERTRRRRLSKRKGDI